MTTRRRVWFHRARAVAWALFGVASFVLGWANSVVLVWMASVYANVVSDFGAAEAADDRSVTDRLDKLDTKLDLLLAALPDPRVRRAGSVAIMAVTDDPGDPRLTHGADPVDGPPVEQAGAYLVLSEAERARGFVRPVRLSYWHQACNTVTSMPTAIAETYAAKPGFYGATYCCGCQRHLPVGEGGDFHWVVPGLPGVQAPKVGT